MQERNINYGERVKVAELVDLEQLSNSSTWPCKLRWEKFEDTKAEKR
jgi:hypothetical protein